MKALVLTLALCLCAALTGPVLAEKDNGTRPAPRPDFCGNSGAIISALLNYAAYLRDNALEICTDRSGDMPTLDVTCPDRVRAKADGIEGIAGDIFVICT